MGVSCLIDKNFVDLKEKPTNARTENKQQGKFCDGETEFVKQGGLQKVKRRRGEPSPFGDIG
jgi:hypothetical protein